MSSGVQKKKSGANRNLILPGVIALAVFLAVGVFWFARKEGAALPVYGTLPAFSFTDARGDTVTRENLMGKVVVADAIYTRCTDTCPLQTATLVQLQRTFQGAKDFQLLSVSVDPEFDRPEVLERYAKARGADLKNWYFLTGDLKAVEDFVVKGLHLPILRSPAPAPVVGSRQWPGFFAWLVSPVPAYAHGGTHKEGEPHPDGDDEEVQPALGHSDRFILLDRKARIRGYYHSEKLASVEQLKKDLWALLDD